jgi:hypothetical protein
MNGHPLLLRALFIFSLGLVLGCARATPDDLSPDTDAGLTLKCQSLTVQAGSIGSGQTASALATAQLTGTQDVWADYVEFAPGTQAQCIFQLPSSTPASSVASLALGINYRGPRQSDMTWQWQAWDNSAAAWVTVGDNGFARDWSWSRATLPLPAPAARFFAGGQLKVRYLTTSHYDASELDQWIVKVTPTTTTPPPPPDMAQLPSADMAQSSAPDLAQSSSDMAQSNSGYWQPHPGTSWQYQISGTVDTSVNAEVYDIDLFDNSAATVAGLKAQGRKVVCYFSAGSYENWRPDVSSFPAAVIGNPLDGWPGENWLDTRAQAVRDIMGKRMDLAVQKGCDGVDPDNVDGYTNNPGFPLTAATQLDYNKFLANAAHARNLAVALKNDIDQIPDLVSYFDFQVNEQCFQYNECDKVQPFVTAGKPVFNVEYGAASLSTTVCPKANALNFDSLIKNLNLDAWRVSCR